MDGVASLSLLREAHHIDQDVTLAINALHSPVTDAVWQVFSNKQIWFVLYAAVLMMLYVRLGWKRATLVVLACVLTVTFCDQFSNFTKAYFERLRPCWDQNMVQGGLHVLEGKGNLYGFYSAHAANAMGFAACSYWAVLVGMSRVFVGKHFFGDVLVGFAVGLLAGWLLAQLARLIIRRFRL